MPQSPECLDPGRVFREPCPAPPGYVHPPGETGRHVVRRIQIDDTLFADDRDMLEDLLAAAVNDAVRRVEANQKDKMSGLMSGMGMPPGFKMPF